MNVNAILGDKPILSSTNFKQKRLSLPDDTATALHKYRQDWKFPNNSIALDNILRRVLLNGTMTTDSYMSNENISISKPNTK